MDTEITLPFSVEQNRSEKIYIPLEDFYNDLKKHNVDRYPTIKFVFVDELNNSYFMKKKFTNL